MIFTETKLSGAFLLDIKKIEDDRGFFGRAFCIDEFEAHGLNPRVAQCNLSLSKQKHTLRGFHYQVEGAEEAKTVRCIEGSILDVIIDLRKDSPTYGEHISVELSANNYHSLYVPEGFAHAYLTLEEDTKVYYHVSQLYTPGKERGIRWNDPYFNIDWPTNDPVLSDKDKEHPDFQL